MTKKLVLFLALLAPLALHADESFSASSGDTRLREALKKAAIELRAAQEANAQLQADKAVSDAAAKDAQEKLDTAVKQAQSDKDAADTEHAKLASQIILLQRQLDDAITKNLALFKLGNEILTRYEHFGLGDALSAKEPFTQLTKVKLENFVQEYQDKLSDQKVKPTQTAQNTTAQ
jgi:hypothetical protein